MDVGFGLFFCQLADFYLCFFFYILCIFFHNCIEIIISNFHTANLQASVSLAVSVSELQSESDARSITTGSCSSSTAISFAQYVRSTDLTWSTHLAHSPGVIALKPSSISPFTAVRLKAKFFLAIKPEKYKNIIK